FEGEYGIFVNAGGKLYIYNSTITALNTSNRYHFKVYSGSFFEMKYSNLSYCGYSSTFESDFGLFIATSNALIEKNNIENNFYGIFVDGVSPKILKNNIQNNEEEGIKAINNSAPLIENNTISTNGFHGIYLHRSSATIINNTIISNGFSFWWYGYNGIVVDTSSSIEIKNNTIISNGYIGIDSVASSGLNIEGNEIIGNMLGITLSNSDAKIIKNHIRGNVLAGISLVTSSNVLIDNNEIENSDYNALILVFESSPTIVNNTLTGAKATTFGDGIMCYGASSPKIDNNTIKNNAHAGISVWRGGTPIISKNNIITSNNYGIYLAGSYLRLINSTITGNTNYDVYSSEYEDWNQQKYPSEAELINVTFTKVGSEKTGIVHVKWFLDVQVVWQSNGAALQGAEVKGYELNNQTVAFRGTADSNGYLKVIAREYTINGGVKKVTTPHNLNASYGKKLGNGVANVDKNTNVKIMLDDVPPYINITSPLDNTITNKTTIVVNGDAELGAKVLVNDEEVTVSQGKFSIEVELTEGNNEIIAKAIDSSENYATSTINVIVDTNPPSLSLVEPKNNTYTNKTSIEVFGIAEQNAKIFVNGEEVENKDGKFSKTIELTNEGNNEIAVKAKDKAGNFAEVKRNVIKDTHPPSLVVISPTESFITNKLKVITVTGMVSDNIGLGELKINGMPIIPSGDLFTYQIGLNEGKNLIEVSAKDKAGNVNKIIRKVVYDTTPPKIRIDEPINKSITNKKEIYVKGTTEEDTIIELNGEAVELKEGKFSSLIQIEEGKNKIKIKGTDKAGNVGYVEVIITLDSKEPNLKVDMPPVVYTRANEYLIIGTVDEEAEVFLNDEKVEIRDGKFSEKIMLKDEGEKVIKISARDKAGNNVTIERKIIVDRTAPYIEITTPKDKTKTKDKRIEIKGKTEPKAKLYINGIETVVNENGNFNYFIELSIGSNNISLRVLDAVGNERTETITVLR
ncbi:MAG: right-handed parallel beta-helix repeat-containing protein, partial [Candidatus Thermoplasmatota archaeon]